MSEIQRVRGEIDSAHPRRQFELCRQAIGWVKSRIIRVHTEAVRTREECMIDAIRNGECPERNYEPILDPIKVRNSYLYRLGAKAVLAIDCLMTTIYGMAAKPFASMVLGALIGIGMTVGVGFAVWAWVKPSFARFSTAKLQMAAFVTGLVGLASLLVSLLPFRGARDAYLDVIVPPAVLTLNLSFALFAAILFELAERNAQLRIRAYLEAMSLHGNLVLFLQELRRKMRDHPFNRGDDDDPPAAGQVVSRILAALLLTGTLAGESTLAQAKAPRFASCHVIVDRTGSVNNQALRASIDILILSLPDIVHALSLRQVEISEWDSQSPWGPPTRSFDMPPVSNQLGHGDEQTLLAGIFPEIRKAADHTQQQALIHADSVWCAAIRKVCETGPVPLLRGLGNARLDPERACSPITDLIARCSYEPSTRLVLLLTDAFDNCLRKVPIPTTSSSTTVVVLLPRNGNSFNPFAERIAELQAHAPWLIVLPAVDLDRGGRWVAKLKALESRDDAQAGAR